MNVLHFTNRGSAYLLVIMLSLGCGGGAPVPADNGSGMPAAEPEGTASDALTLDYLVGEWCSAEEGRSGRTIWMFDEGGTFRRGKPGRLMEGGAVEGFVSSAKLVSRGKDEFVMSQAGLELQFSRGPCPTRPPAVGGP